MAGIEKLTPDGPWTCFHCWEVFANPTQAAMHFGAVPSAEPMCRVQRKDWPLAYAYRELELERDLLQVRVNALRARVDEEAAVRRFLAVRNGGAVEHCHDGGEAPSAGNGDDPPADPREQAFMTALEDVHREHALGMDVCAVIDVHFEVMLNISFDNGVSLEDFEGLLDDMRAAVGEWWRDREREPVIEGHA
jgi:hypothetical protein